jgi:hypothetical protein
MEKTVTAMTLPESEDRLNLSAPIDLLNDCDHAAGRNRLVVYLWVQRLLGLHPDGDAETLIAVLVEKTNLSLHDVRVAFYSLCHQGWVFDMAFQDLRWTVNVQEHEEGARK